MNLAVRLAATCATFVSCACNAFAQVQTPLTGHYPPGQSGLRGAVSPEAGLAYTNFNRLFSNLRVEDAAGNTAQELDELRYANISMVAWTTDAKILGMRYGAVAGVPFSTGNLRPVADEVRSTSLGLGDVLLTPLALYGRTATLDYQLQFTVWSASGRFSPGAHDNRGTGFWSLVYSIGGVFYPGADRDRWSLSAIARIEQNFEQQGSGVTPGDDIVIDWGIGRVVRLLERRIDLGVSGFGAWQVTAQSGGEQSIEKYRLFGAGPEASMNLTERLSLRARAQWEFGARNVVSGNNVWIILGYQF